MQTLQAEEEAWKLFRRALRKEDQEAFDALWRFARYHAAPASMASRPMPFEAALMAMMVAVERQILEMEKLEKKRRGDGGGQNGGLAL
ncbi:MAG TPA: hypothetical protein VN915_07355 [Elusimicrobiota bacterium]|nr:hypothetical protein [Elusimicrobiota bacterium]